MALDPNRNKGKTREEARAAEKQRANPQPTLTESQYEDAIRSGATTLRGGETGNSYINQSEFTRYNPRAAEQNAANQEAQRAQLNLGIRPGQFGDINEAAGERVVIVDGKAQIQNADGQEVRRLANDQVFDVDAQTAATRREVGAPLISSQSGAMGKAGKLGASSPISEYYQEPDFSTGSYSMLSAPEQEAIRTERLNQAAIQEQLRTTQQQRAREQAQVSATATGVAEQRAKEAQQSEVDSIANQVESRKAQIKSIADSSNSPISGIVANIMEQEEQNMLDAIASSKLNRAEDKALAFKQYKDRQDLLDKFTEIHRQENDKYTRLLQETAKSQNEYIDTQRQNDLNRLTWESDSATQKQERQKTKQLLSQSIQNALSGGAFSGAANEQLASTEREWDQAIADLAKEYSFQKTDVSAYYTQKHIDTNNQLRIDLYNAAKELDSVIEGYTIQGFNSLQARDAAIAEANNTHRDNVVKAQEAYVKAVKEQTKEAKEDMRFEIQQKQQKEDRALERIDYLLKNYDRKDVSEAIKELGKDVTSFDVQALIDNPTLAEIQRARKAVGAGGGFFSGFNMQGNAPAITYDEFINQKISEKEESSGMSLSPEARKEYIAVNSDYFKSQYDQLTSPSFENITSGNPKIDAATDAYMRGDLTIVQAAKAFNVPQADIASYAGVVRERGSKIGDIRALQSEQQKELTKLRSEIDSHEVTKALKVMDVALPKINAARSSLTGVGDVALLNFYQNGIVDPGLAVRGEDAKLLQAASALRDKISPDFVLSVINEGAFFPDETRAEMQRIAKEVYRVTEGLYNDEVYNPIVQQASLSGIGEPYFSYKSRGGKSAQKGANANDYLSSQGFP